MSRTKDGMYKAPFEMGLYNYLLHRVVKGRIIKAEFYSVSPNYWMPNEGEALSQYLTVTRKRGHVTTCYEYEPVEVDMDASDEEFMKAMSDSEEKSVFTISAYKAEHLFSILESFFSEKQLFPYMIGKGTWTLKLITDRGEAVKYHADSGSDYSLDGNDISNLIREDLGLPDFWALD
ncbi:MAG: hypothetical protein LUE27_03110 [Clostridia bacterium]|nr:hypothetical protein [Clostridia bacterium]